MPSPRELSAALQAIAAEGLTRRRRLVDSPCAARMCIEGREMLAFAANDYLGLANHPAPAEAMAEGARQWGAGSGASHLVSGHLAPHQQLEDALAECLGFPRVLTFSTGYLANLAVIPTLTGRGDAVFADKLNHASLIDGVRLSLADNQRYPHKDMATLERQLAASTAPCKLIVSDAVFSMDGDLASLAELLALAERFDAWLLVDDAHGFGVLGPHGAGSLSHCGIGYHPRIVLMGTLGKAAGVSGAYVAGSAEVIEYLLQRARSYIFTTATPPAVACALLQSLSLIRDGDALRATLQSHITRLQSGLAGLPWHLLPSPTAIQPLIVGDNQAALDLSSALWERGIWVPAIRPPTVPKGTARLRISLSAAHTAADIDQLIAALRTLAPNAP